MLFNKQIKRKLGMVILVLLTAMPALAEDPVYFTDEHLESKVEEYLGVVDPTPTDMLALTVLDVPIPSFSQKIVDLTGLEYAVNLTYLSLVLHRISDLSPLSGLIKLEYLEMEDNMINDIGPLSNLTNLTYLGLRNNDSMTDIGPLLDLTNLITLNLFHSESISDFSPLSDLTNLTSLNLSYTRINDLSLLSGLINLTDLGLSNNQLIDVNSLSGLTNLEELTLNNNLISNINSLSGLVNLTSLNLFWNKISTPRALADMINLTDLDLSYNPISDISLFAEFTNLSYLNLRGLPLDCLTYETNISMIRESNPGIYINYIEPVCVPDIEVSPPVHDFGDVEVGTSKSFTVTVFNVGDNDLSLECLGMQIDGDDLTISLSSSIPSIIYPGDNININVVFSPSSEGYSSGSLIINSDDPDESIVEVTFGGTGIAVSNQAPNAGAGDNIQISSADQVYTVLYGTATDADGDALTYRWLDGSEVVLDWSAVGFGGEAYLDLGTLSYLSTGNHTLTLEVSDGALSNSDDMVLTVENSPPEAVPGPSSQTVQIGIDPIIIVANVADSDGDTLAYEWLKDGEVLGSGNVSTPQGGDAVAIPDLDLPAGDARFAVGEHQVELRLSDGINAQVSAFVSVKVIDTTAPSLSPIPSVTILWPPNHELGPVTIQANAFDNGGGAVQLSVEVVSDEPEDGIGDGGTLSDYVIVSVDNETGLIELLLRAERAGKSDGRTYTITITAIDEDANQSVAILEILAPHDRRKK